MPEALSSKSKLMRLMTVTKIVRMCIYRTFIFQESNYYRVNKGKNKALNDNYNHLINNHQLLKFDTFMHGYGPVWGGVKGTCSL